MLYKVPVPHIYHQAIIEYLKRYELITNGVTYQELCDPNFLRNSDAVTTFTERTYDFRGRLKGAQKTIYVSVKKFGRFMSEYIILAKRNNKFEKIFNGELELPDITFKIAYQQLLEERTSKPLKEIIYAMLKDHSSLAVHLNFVDACSTTDRWYIRNILHYNAKIFQEPYIDSNVKELTLQDSIYPYHIYTYATNNVWRNFRLTDKHKEDLQRIREFTPASQRRAYSLLPPEKQNKIKKLFGQEEVEVKPEINNDESETDSEEEDGRYEQDFVFADV